MQQVSAEIRDKESLIDVEDRVASLGEVFRLQGADELAEAERRYAGAVRRRKAIILAATRGEGGLEMFTEQQPKVMVPVAGQPLLRRLIDEFKAQDIHDISVVAGYRADAIDAPVDIIVNAGYERSGELASLLCAADTLDHDTVIIYGDLLFRSYVLRDLLHIPGELTVVVDSAYRGEASGHANDLAYCSAFDDRSLYGQAAWLEHVTKEPHWQGKGAAGCWVGLMRVVGKGRCHVLEALETLRARPDFATLGMPHLLNALIAAEHPVRVMYIAGHWLDINNVVDLQRANEFAQFAPART